MLANKGAGGGEGVILPDESYGVLISAGLDKGNIARNVNVRRTERNAGNSLVKAAKAGSLEVGFIVLPEAVQTAQNHLRGFIAYCAVGGGVDYPGGFFNKVKRAFRCVAVKDGFDKLMKLTETDAAGRAFSARLAVADVNKGGGHVNGTNAYGVSLQTADKIAVDLVDNTLSAYRGWN